MKYIVVESKLKTNKTRDYLWNKINSPKKIIKIEEFNKNSTVKKISQNNYEVLDKDYHVLVSFIPKSGVNQIFVGRKNFPMTWFEITESKDSGTQNSKSSIFKGEKNCTITHGEYKRIDSGMSKENLKKEINWLKNHFLEELREIAK